MARRFDILINAKDNNASATFTKIAGSMGALFSANVIKNYISDLVDLGDTIGKTATRAGIAAEDFQKYAFAARRGGATSADVEKAFKRMSSTIFDANRGIKESVDALNTLGLTVEQFQNKKPAEQFNLIADALNNVTDATDKAALAQDIFGRAGTNLIPMLSNYKKLGKELERIGGIISNDNVKAAEDFKDAIEDLTTAIKALVANSGIIQFLADVAKTLTEIQRIAKSLGAAKIFGQENPIQLAVGEELTKTIKKAASQVATSVAQPLFGKTVAEESKKALPTKLRGTTPITPDFFDDLEKEFKEISRMLDKDTTPEIKPARILKDIIPTGPQQAFVTRGLSGLGTTMKPANETAKNTKATANAAQETNQKLDTIIGQNAQSLQNSVGLSAANFP